MPGIESFCSDSWCFPMRPSKPSRRGGDLFRERLDAIIDMGHPLVRLGELVPWSDFDEAFGRFYKPVGRPAKPTRLLVGLHYLKHTSDLSLRVLSTSATDRSLSHDPLAQADRARGDGAGPAGDGRGGVGEQDGEALELGAGDGGYDGAAQSDPHPTDSRLYLKALEILVRQAKKAGITLRQSHTRLAKKAAAKAARYAHAKQYKRMRRELKRLRTYLGHAPGTEAPQDLSRAGLSRRLPQDRRPARAGSPLCQAPGAHRAAACATALGQEQALLPACS
jgi:IS5 family transposase